MKKQEALRSVKERIQNLSKNKIAMISAVTVLVLLVIAIIANFAIRKNSHFGVSNPELARAMNYEEFEEKDEAVEGTDNVKFSSFFLRDINDDGYAEKIKGTCKQIGREDTLYMEIIVQTAGYLKDAKIQVAGKNFYLQTALPKDQQIKENAIGNNIKEIAFNEMANGTQKLLTGIVRSGDYSYDSGKMDAIGRNINNYSRNDNQIILTGTYVDEDGNETPITKTIDLTMDWYGTTEATIYSANQSYSNLDSLLDEENNTIHFGFILNTEETRKELNISKSQVEGEIPELNGYAPSKVTIQENVKFEYNENTRKFTITKEATTDEEGNITSSVGRKNTYNITVEYPLEAYEALGADTVELRIPTESYYEGYNNPNSEFSNPYKSNIAKTTIIANYSNPKGTVARFNVTVGNYIGNPGYYMISKQKPLKIYNGISREEKEDTYLVRWNAYTGSNGEAVGIIMKETKNNEAQVTDQFIKIDNTEESMENVTTHVGIGFSGADNMLNEDGWIKVYDDETGDLLVTFTKDNWNQYTARNPYQYELPVKHIRIETSNTKKEASFCVYHTKKLDDEYITANLTKEQFDNLQYIKSTLTGYIGENYINQDTHQANYEAPYSMADIGLSNNTLSTQETEKNEKMTITARYESSKNQVGWVNGSFLVKLPKEIIDVQINHVEINNSKVLISSYELLEKDGYKLIKINTQNRDTNPQTYSITVDADLTPDPRVATITKNIELYASNEEITDYKYASNDIYDVNDNLNTEEKVSKAITRISLVSPNSLLTNQTASDYDEKGSMVISPQVADIKANYAVVNGEEKTAKIGIEIKNNYTSTISDVLLLGKIPFEGNTYVLASGELGSTFTTKMTNKGIAVPEELQGKVTVYYSENTSPDKDINKLENGWKTIDKITNWDNVKTYLIDFESFIIPQGKEYVFNYTIKIPNGLNYNQVAYSQHGIYFSLNTPEGKYRTQTEPNKLGFRIAEKYNLSLTKYQTGKDKLVPGATYRITEEGQEEGRTAVTNNEGKLQINNLYAEKIYTIQEIKTPEDYELNGDIIKFIGHIDKQGNLSVEKLEGTIKEEFQAVKQEGEEYKVTVGVEDEVRLKLKLAKFEKDTNKKLKNIAYNIKGTGLPDQGKTSITNANGEIILSGLYMNQEYTIQELNAEGYYVEKDPVKFIVLNREGNYEIQITNGKTKNSGVALENEIPVANIELEDKKIPEYSLEIIKKARGKETTLPNVYFKIHGENRDEIVKTDENGKIQLDNLYIFDENELEVTGEYTLEEVVAPVGYIKNNEIIKFKVAKKESSLEVNILEGKVRNSKIENNTLCMEIENDPIFQVVKKDGETSELLPNVKFAIYKMEGEEKYSPATNSKGELVGDIKNINGTEYRVVSTNENGEISLDLSAGIYKLVEVETLERYHLEQDEEDRSYYFSIGDVEDGFGYGKIKEINKVNSHNAAWYDIFHEVVETNDGYALIKQYEKDEIIEKNNENITIEETSNYLVYLNKNDKVDKITNLHNAKIRGIGYINEKIMLFSSIDAGTIFSSEQTVNGVEIKIDKTDGYQIIVNENGKIEKVLNIGYAINTGDLEEPWLPSINEIKQLKDGDYILSGSLDVNSAKKNFIINADVTKDKEDIILTHDSGWAAGILIKYDKNNEVISASIVDSTIVDITQVDELKNGDIVATIDTRAPLKIKEEYTENGETINIDGNYISAIARFNSDLKVKWCKVISVEGGIRNFTDSIVDNNGDIVVVGNLGYNIKIPAEDTVNNEEIVIEALSYGGSTTRASKTPIIIKYREDGKIYWATAPSLLWSGNYYERPVESAESFIGTGVAGISLLNDGSYLISVDNPQTFSSGLPVINPILTENNKHISVDTAKKSYIINYNSDGKIKNVIGSDIAIDTVYHAGTNFKDFMLNDNYYFAYGNKLYKYQISLTDIKEKAYIEVENDIKQFKITTDVKEVYGVKGGNISGEDSLAYESVKYGENSKKEITMTPDENYEIIKITVNGENYKFEAKDDGTYTMPQFEEVTEDKHIEVTYATKSNKMIISKIDSETKQKVAGAKIGITYMGNTDVSSVIGPITNNGTYYFVENNGQYVSNNQGKRYETANSYTPIDLSNRKGEYKLTVNAEISAYNYSYGYATIREDTKAPKESDSDGRFIYLSGIQSQQDYNIILQGGKKYYLHLGYYRGYGTEGTDTFTINSINLRKNDTYEALETNQDGNIITEKEYGEYEIKEIEAPEGYILNENPTKINFNESETHEFIVENDRIPSVLVHHYIKGTTTKVAEDEKQEGNTGESYTTSPKLDLEKYEIEKNQDGEYMLPSNAVGVLKKGEQIIVTYYYVEKKLPLTVHHYIEGTEEAVPLKDGSKAQDEKYEGKQGESYTTSPLTSEKLSEKYELVTIPENASGVYREDEIIVTYYYKEKQVKVTTKVQTHKETNAWGEEIEVKGGSILGEGEKPYEEITYGETSTKDIIATPEEGYYVKEITVNGEKIEFTANDDKTVTLSKFVNMTEDKEVVVSFEKIQGNVIVHHYIAGTTTKVPAQEGGEVQDITKTGTVGDAYITKEAENVSENYELVAIPENSSGTITLEDTIVTYYYRLKTPSIETPVINKTSTIQKVTEETQKIPYTITYTVAIDQYMGDATITIVDQLPYAISLLPGQFDLDGGTYNEANKTITWTEDITDIDTFANGKKQINITKTIQVTYKDLEVTKANVENTVTGTIDLKTPEVTKTVTGNKSIPTEFTKEVTATKVWVDNEIQAQRRPESIILVVKKGETEVARHEVSTENVQHGDNNKWSYTFTDLDKYDENGKEIDYTVDELEKQANDLHFYEKTLNQTTVTNTYKTPNDTTEVTVNKVWNDNETQAQRRPETIVLQVKKGNEIVQSYELPTASEANHTFTGLAKYDANGQEIEYTVDELEKTEGDLHFYEKEVTKVEDKQATIRNTYKTPDDITKVTVNKVWVDNETQKARRPEAIILQVKKAGKVVKEAVVKETDGWNCEFELPKYDENGVEITYTADERVLEGEEHANDLKFYEKSILGTTITNTYKTPEDKTQVTVNKIWSDNEIQAQRRPENIILVVKNKEIEVARHEIKVATENSYTFTGLPKYNENGQEIKYTVDELEKTEKDLYFYQKSIVGTTITNTFTRPEDKTEVTVRKVWIDNNNQAKKRPESIILQLKDGNVKVEEATVTANQQLQEHSNIWEYTFTGLNKYNENGQEIKYTVDEAEVNSGDLQFYEKSVSGTTLTNTFTQNTDKINVTAKKIWVDTKTQKEKRPESIMVILKRNETPIDRKELAINKTQDEFTVTFENLPKYDSYNNIINYTVDETVVEGEEHSEDMKFYTKSISGTTITNTFTKPNDKVSVTVNKEWVDKDNIYARRPELLALKVINQATKEEVARKTIVVKTEKEATFANLDKYDENGNEIIYTADEEEVYENDLFNYEKKIGKLETISKDKKQITITNTMVKTPGNVIVKYIDKQTNQEIADRVEKEGIVGEEFDVSGDKKEITGYTLVEEPDKKTGTYTEEDQVKTYYYARNTKVIVKYLEKGSNQVLASQDEIRGYEGLEYHIIQKAIDGYTFVESTNNTNGTMARDEIEVIYYYAKNTRVIVKYVEKGTNQVLTPQNQYEVMGYEGKDYTTEQKDIAGYTFIESTNNTSGVMTKDEIEVIYYYAKNTKVIVNHLEKDTNVVLADQEEIEGYEGKDYETSKATIENYTFVESTDNTKGNMTKETIVVNYYYAQNTKATVQHIDRETGNILKQESEEGKVGDLFETHPEDFKDYVLVESPKEPNVVMTKEEQVVKYYYAHISAGVIEKHIDDVTGELLDSKEHKGNEGDPYDIASKTFDGYDLVEEKLPDNSKGNMQKEVIEVKYYYQKKATVRVQYVDKLTGETIEQDIVIEGHENDDYTTEKKDIKNYVFVESTDNTTGKMEVTKNEDGTYNKETVVTYYYIKKSAGVLEKHIDISNNKILAQEKHEGKVGDSYDIEPRIFDGYKLVETRLPQNAKGSMKEELIEVDYYYVKQAKVTVKYIDKLTGKEIDEEEILGYEGDKYEAEDKQFDGYDLVEIPNNKTGEMQGDDIVVKYYYDKKVKVVVQYLEKGTNNPLLEKEEINGHIGDKYETDQKEIAYYKFVESTNNTKGNMTDKTIEVIYYYQKQIFNLKVDKWVSQVTLNGIPQGGKNINSKDEMYKLEIHRNKVDTANVKVTYKIRISNIGEIEGKVDKLTEIIPNGFSFHQEDNQIHWENNNGILTTTDLENETILANQYQEIAITLRWKTSEDNLGQKDNLVLLSQISNSAGYQDIDRQDNRSKANMMITVATGLDRNDRIVIIGIIQIVLAISMGLLVSYKKKTK